MTFEDFDFYSRDLLEKVVNMRNTKGKEYAGNKDRFDNFNRLAARLDIDRKKIWQVYFTKHLDAIESFIRDNKEHSSEGIEGRIVDAITYLTLLAGMIKEEKELRHKEANRILGTEIIHDVDDNRMIPMEGTLHGPLKGTILDGMLKGNL